METTRNRDELLSRATMVKVIPTVSGIMEKAMGLLASNDSSFKDINEVIKYDQAISSKIISIANSAYYSRGAEISNLQRAMMTIGFEEVKKIVMCIIFINDMLKNLNLKGKDLLNLWKHSASVACAARALSKKMLVEDPQKVFTVSLLHDIGKSIMYMNAEDYHGTIREATAKGRDLDGLERELYGIDHQELGYAIGVKWHFPEEFLYVLRYHHGTGADKYQDLVRLVGAADGFALALHKEPGPEGYLLLSERPAINAEMQRIVDFLHMK